MKVDEELIKHVADVSRLELTKQEIDLFIPQLKEILESFDVLKEVDVDGINPSFQPVEMKNHLREDKVEKSLNQEDALKLGKHEEGYFIGPKAV
jgi:aspartyl-tRNA(Asn)/glutamyl-tRNA(Gln) amidotransferase subunit C